MKFNSPSEILRFYVAVCGSGTSGAGIDFSDEAEDEDVLLSNEYDSGQSDPMAWANIINEKVDIENALNRVFNSGNSRNRRSWVIQLLIHWAVDGYNETIDHWFAKISPFYSSVHRDTRRNWLNRFISEITDEFIRIGYLKSDTNAFKGLPFYSEASK